jgi:LPS sulfotransferase NodH
MTQGQSQQKKGVLILSEARSGSSWLCSLARQARLGNPKEWLNRDASFIDPYQTPWGDHFPQIMEKASADNGCFAIKIFPHQLHRINHAYKTDFIQYVKARHPINFVVLTRRDRLGQAISLTRSFQTNRWKSTEEAKGKAFYDFDMICRAYFMIGQSYDFWQSYLDITGEQAKHFVYEDLMDDPSPFLNHMADCLGQARPAALPPTDLKIQRDDTTQHWREQFLEEIKTKPFLDHTTPSRPINRSLSNIIRMLRGRQVKPYPYGF